jgi:hypothetical protein
MTWLIDHYGQILAITIAAGLVLMLLMLAAAAAAGGC